MPKSKKPRKKHHTRFVRPLIPLEQVEKVKAEMREIDLIAEIKLPRGTMCMDDVLRLREYINLATALIEVGYGIDRDFVHEKYDEDWNRMRNSFHSFCSRVKEKGSYTATASELNAIRDGLVIADAIVNAALDADPINVARTWAGLQRIVEEEEDEENLGLIEVVRSGKKTNPAVNVVEGQ